MLKQRFNGEKLRELRENRGWTVRDMALQLGVAPSAVSRWESGTHSPYKKRQLQIAGLFRINPKKLLVAVEEVTT
jgi:transcriptional regulator with XRE-family HTH domain